MNERDPEGRGAGQGDGKACFSCLPRLRTHCQVCPRFTKDVTHVVFKDGKLVAALCSGVLAGPSTDLSFGEAASTTAYCRSSYYIAARKHNSQRIICSLKLYGIMDKN